MWTHSIIFKDPNDADGFRVDVEYTKGKTKIIRRYHPTSLEAFKESIQNELDRRNAGDELEPQIDFGEIELK